MNINIKKLHNNAIIPVQAHNGDAGVDLCSIEHVILPSKHWACVNTGLAIELPVGYEAQVRPRSGLSSKHGVTVLNAPGTIDSGYRGEIGVILINHGFQDFEIAPGMKIAQMVIARHETVSFTDADALSETERGVGGFGSTGL